MQTVSAQSPLKLATMAVVIRTACKSMEILQPCKVVIAEQVQLGIRLVQQLGILHLPTVHRLMATLGIAPQTELEIQHLRRVLTRTATVSPLRVMSTVVTNRLKCSLSVKR